MCWVGASELLHGMDALHGTCSTCVKPAVERAQSILMSATAAVECVERACEQIRGSAHLAEVLRAVLATGNTLNAGTHRGQAAGIKLESLLKLADVKARPRLCSAYHHKWVGTSLGVSVCKRQRAYAHGLALAADCSCMATDKA